MDAIDPYRPPEGRVDDVLPERLAPPLASRGRRLWSAIVDSFISIIVAVPFVGPLFDGRSLLEVVQSPEYFWRAGASSLLLFAVNLYFLHEGGQTMGKKIVGTRIVRRDGSRAGLARIVFLRILPFTAAAFIPIIGGLLVLLDVLLIFRADRRCLHDHFASTIVILA